MSSIVEEVAGIKQEQEAQRGDLVRINNSIKELAEAMQGTTVAINSLSVKYDKLINNLNMYQDSSKIGIPDEHIKNITMEMVNFLQREGFNIFEPLKKNVIKLNKDFEEAGECATWRIANIGKKSWWHIVTNSFMVALWYVAITSGILYWGFGLDDIEHHLIQLRKKVEVIHYNQTIEGAKYTPWDMEKFNEAWLRHNDEVNNGNKIYTNDK